LRTCGWEGRDFIDLLEDYLSDQKAGDNKKILGPIEKWWAKGFAAGRETRPENSQITVERVKAVLSEATPAMAQAVESVEMRDRLVVVQFRRPDQLVQTPVADRMVECLLYQ
jgi:hypothetical protein